MRSPRYPEDLCRPRSEIFFIKYDLFYAYLDWLSCQENKKDFYSNDPTPSLIFFSILKHEKQAKSFDLGRFYVPVGQYETNSGETEKTKKQEDRANIDDLKLKWAKDLWQIPK